MDEKKQQHNFVSGAESPGDWLYDHLNSRKRDQYGTILMKKTMNYTDKEFRWSFYSWET